MNQHLFDLKSIQRILRSALACNIFNDIPQKPFDEAAFVRLKDILNAHSEVGFDTQKQSIQNYIKAYNESRASDSSRIGIPEWLRLINFTIQNGNFGDNTNKKLNISWLIFVVELKECRSNDQSMETAWIALMKRFIKLGYLKNAQLLHNYLYTFYKLSKLLDKNENTYQDYVKQAAQSLLDGLEISKHVELELMESLLNQLFTSKISQEFFSKSKIPQYYQGFDAEDPKLKFATQFMKEITIEIEEHYGESDDDELSSSSSSNLSSSLSVSGDGMLKLESVSSVFSAPVKSDLSLKKPLTGIDSKIEDLRKIIDELNLNIEPSEISIKTAQEEKSVSSFGSDSSDAFTPDYQYSKVSSSASLATFDGSDADKRILRRRSSEELTRSLPVFSKPDEAVKPGLLRKSDI